jgi:hypothetical protein
MRLSKRLVSRRLLSLSISSPAIQHGSDWLCCLGFVI